MPKLNYAYLKKEPAPDQAEPQADQAEANTMLEMLAPLAILDTTTPPNDIDAIKKGALTTINLPGTNGAFLCSYRDGNRKVFAVAYSPEGKILSIGV